MSLFVKVSHLQELHNAADLLLKAYPSSRIFAFEGNMGAGKTTFIKSICDVLGVSDVVSSPTFSIVNEYRSAAGEKVFHFDFYRIKDKSEAYDMGYEDYFYSGAWCFIEWPGKIEGLLPANAVLVHINVAGEDREITVKQ
jgi:tRNA threonylcarbamoyladenosine biosynthesis protein TsaE